MLQKLIFSILLTVFHVQVEVSDSLYGQKYDDLSSYELTDAYDINGTVNGKILFVWRKPVFDYDTNRDGSADISDLVNHVNFTFGMGL